MLHSAASDLGLHCLPITLYGLGVSRLKQVKTLTSPSQMQCIPNNESQCQINCVGVLWPSQSIFCICVEVLRPSQPNGVMMSVVSLPNHTFPGQA